MPSQCNVFFGLFRYSYILRNIAKTALYFVPEMKGEIRYFETLISQQEDGT